MQIDRQTNVLVVDKRRSIARLISDILRKLHFENVQTTFDAPSAFDLLQGAGPTLIIADLHLTPMSGLEFLRMVRANSRVGRYPCLITAEVLNPFEARALKDAGADGILLKPFTGECLEPKIAAALARYEKSRRAVGVSVQNQSTTLGRRKQSRGRGGRSRYRVS
jgi:DNA-binding response OmpR family regulator